MNTYIGRLTEKIQPERIIDKIRPVQRLACPFEPSSKQLHISRHFVYADR